MRGMLQASGRALGARAWRKRWMGLEGLESRVLLSATDTILHSFAGRPSDGSVPQAGLILVGNKLYGVTQNGGPNDDGSGGGPGLGHHGGTLFSVNTDGSGYQVLHDFGGTSLGVADGYEPLANLTFFNGEIYGTTPFGGPGGGGTIFAINPDGSGYHLIHAFGSTDPVHTVDFGEFPEWAALVPLNGKLYGIATAGGRPAASGGGDGVLFSINGDGTDYTEVHVFDFGPNVATYDHGFVTDGTKFYGITAAGGPTNSGRIWSMNVDGSGFQILHDLDPTTDGHGTLGTLTLVGNTLWGTTADSGPNGGGTLFSMNVDGTNFTVQHAFSTSLTGPDGVFPHTDLLQVGNKLYGSTTTGGPGFTIGFAPVGEIFSINTDGTGFTSVFTFNGVPVNGVNDGATPYGALASDGTKLFGVTGGGGVNSIGTIFSLEPGQSGTGSDPLMGVSVGGNALVSGQGRVNFGTTTKGSAALTETFTVTNSGGAPLTVGEPALPAGFKLTTAPSGTVAAGGSTTFVVSLPTTAQGLFGGNITISNNSGGATNTFTITVEGRINAGSGGGGGGAGPADLTVSVGSPKPTRSVLVPGDKVSVPVVVKNGGSGTATGPFVVMLRASADNVYDDTDVLLGQFSVNSLKGGKTMTKVVKFTLPAGTAVGNMFFVAEADTTGVVAESNETNNTGASAAMTVALEFGKIPGRSGSTALTVSDSDGTLVTFKMAGAGMGQVSMGAGGMDVTVTGSTAGSGLTITTKSSGAAGDDGRFTLDDLVIGGSIGKITGTTTDLVGTLSIGGTLTQGSLGNVRGGTITATAVASLAIGGTLSNSTITLSQGVNKKPTLGKLTAGSVVGTQIRSAGNIGRVQAGVLDHSVVFAGVLSSVTGRPATAADFVTTVGADLPTIASVVLTGAGAVLINSTIAAGAIGSVKMPTGATAVSDVDQSVRFGFATVVGPVKKYVGPASAGNFVSGSDSVVS